MKTHVKGYADLKIYNTSFELAHEVHKMSLTLPKYELYESGSQVRRSSKSITANIVEGYGRKRYHAEFIRFLIFSHASCDETIVHLKMINLNHFNNEKLNDLIDKFHQLSKQIFNFIDYVEKNWKTGKG